jgi:hypothetical protein
MNEEQKLNIAETQQLNIADVMPMLHQIARCIDAAIENNIDESKISDIVELMKGIADDNWVFIRNEA